jgi:hypothetical protein
MYEPWFIASIISNALVGMHLALMKPSFAASQKPSNEGSDRCSALQRLIQIIRAVEQLERPIAAIDHALPMLRCGPLDRTFAAGAKFAIGVFSQCGQSELSLHVRQ